MKLNKTLALVGLLAGGLLVGATLQAQDAPKDKPPGERGGPGGPGMRGRPNLDQIAKDLNLTDDQKAKVKTAMEDMQNKMKALRDDTNLKPEDKRAKAKEIREGFTATMKEILTAEQFEKWQKHMQDRPRGGGPRGPGGPGGSGGKGGSEPNKE